MTVVEMHHDFLLKAKSLDRVDVKDILSYDAVALLNQAQDIVIDELLMNKNYALLRPITESVATALIDFDGSYDSGIKDAKVVNLTNATFDAALSAMSYRDYIRSTSNIDHASAPTFTGADVSNEEVPVEIIKDFETNGSNVPIFTNPKCFVEGDYLIVLGDGYTTFVNIVAVVVRHPKALALSTASPTTEATTCELPSKLHPIIVNKAVQLYDSTVNVNDVKR